MRDLIREEADKYQDFFNFMSKEHNLTLTVSEMDEIVIQSQKLVNNLLKPDVSGSALATCVKCGSFIFTMDARKCVGCGHLR